MLNYIKASFLTIALIFSFITLNALAYDNTGCKLELTIHCDQNDFNQGDEIPIIFTITNKGQSIYRANDRDGDRSGRQWEYQLFAFHEDGTLVKDPRENWREGPGGGLGGWNVNLEHGQSYNKPVALNRWSLIKEPGRYKVTATYYPERAGPNDVAKSLPIEITVKPRDYNDTGRYIEKLIAELNVAKQRNQRNALFNKLEYTCDSRILPTMINALYDNNDNNKDDFWANEAIACYLPHDSNTKDAISKSIDKRGLWPWAEPYILEQLGFTRNEITAIIKSSLDSNNIEIKRAGVFAAQFYHDDSFMSNLIDIAKDANGVARSAAIYAISKNRTDEGVQTLKLLLTDKDEEVRKDVKEDIEHAYRVQPFYLETIDEEFTDELAKIALDFNNPRGWMAVMEIIKTRTKEGIESLKILLDDPNKDVPLAQTDKGIMAVKFWLQHPDKEVRKTATYYIKEFCFPPGRPLRPDDFPEIYKANLEQYEQNKQKMLDSFRRKLNE